jgi:hypothetical protein
LSVGAISDAGEVRFGLFGRRRGFTSTQPDLHRTGASDDWADLPVVAGLVLGDEAEAYVNGELAAFRVERQRTLAPWMLINGVAHRDAVDLQLRAQGRPCPNQPRSQRRSGRVWASAEHWLAAQLVGLARDAEEVRVVQRTVLQPLEHQFIARSRIERLALGNVLADITDALDDYRLRR